VSAAKNLYNALVAEFPHCLLPITELSKPDDEGKFFVESDYSAFNFDLVKSSNPSDVKEKSPDAIFLNEDELVFVEFKSGGFKRAELRSKIHEGLTTLFQFASAKGIVDRENFFDIPIHYVVVVTQDPSRGSGFQQALEMSGGYSGLRNLEGFLLRKTSLLSKPDHIFGKFQEITSNKISKINIEDNFLRNK
jgi:hypothetical protein